MRRKVFTLRYAPDADGFEDAFMQTFLGDKQVLAVQEHFFVHEQVPTWVLLVSYRDLARPGETNAQSAADARADPRAELGRDEVALYDALRKWRNDRARHEGRPAYILLTNRQMAEVARRRPMTLAALREIHGVGDAKAEMLGEELVALVRSVPLGASATAAATTSEPDPPVATEGAHGP